MANGEQGREAPEGADPKDGADTPGYGDRGPAGGGRSGRDSANETGNDKGK